MAQVLVVDVESSDIREAVCEELDDFYRELKCDCFDIARRKIGEKYFDIFCDDIGLFAEDPVVSAVDENGKPMLVGNLVIANHDDHGNTTSLTQDDLEIIKNNLTVCVSKKGIYPALKCRY